MAEPAEPLLIRLSDLTEQPVHWLWPGYLAAGKLCLIDGDPSQGKSLMTLDLAARLSSGRELPDGHRPEQPTSVLLLSCEDGARDTILPRLRAAGANLRRVNLFEGPLADDEHRRLPLLPEDCPLLAQAVERTGAKLIVIDPLMAFLGIGYASINDQMVRQALGPVARLAEVSDCCVALVRHLNKGGQGQKAIYRGSGSIGIIAAARTAFLVGRDPDDAEVRVLACTKNNLAAFPPSLGYRIAADANGQPVVQWTGPVPRTADQLVGLPGSGAQASALDQAADWLRETLAKEPVPAADVLRRGRAAGFAEITLQRAKAAAGVRSVKAGRPSVWWWFLPGTSATFDRLADAAAAPPPPDAELPPLTELFPANPLEGTPYGDRF